MIVIGSNTSDNGHLRFTEDVSHFMELRLNRQLALLKRSAKNGVNETMLYQCNPTAFYQSSELEASLKPVGCKFNFGVNEPLSFLADTCPF